MSGDKCKQIRRELSITGYQLLQAAQTSNTLKNTSLNSVIS